MRGAAIGTPIATILCTGSSTRLASLMPRDSESKWAKTTKIREFLAIIEVEVYLTGRQAPDDAAPDDAASDDAMEGVSLDIIPELLDLMRHTLDILSEDQNVDPGDIYTWFIPEEVVTFDVNTPTGEGSFGVLYLGTWAWAEEAVGVKILYGMDDDDEAFSQELHI